MFSRLIISWLWWSSGAVSDCFSKWGFFGVLMGAGFGF
jgi:hypothetical protein